MQKEIDEIISLLLSGEKITSEEQLFFDRWYEEKGNKEKYQEYLRIRSILSVSKISKEIEQQEAWEELSKRIGPHHRLMIWQRYAAAVVLLFCIGISFFMLNPSRIEESDLPLSQCITPGKKQATLTLSNGQQISLSDNLSQMTEKNGAVIQNTGTQLVYQPQDSTEALVYNTITVPRGGEYILALSDGSTIWINSESEITYPVVFSKTNREIRLKGEAFFDIKKDTLRPFIVQTDQFNIRVTGTQFNIRTYSNDIASATLAKGSIQLEKDHKITRLLPGQQVSLINNRVKVRQVDVEEIIAWRNEAFCFKDRPLESILNEIARWYDIEIFYQNNEIRNYHFTAWFRRSSSIDDIIHILEKTQNIKLELKGKTLTIKTISNN
ncbi:MAG: DUF4974 domain-containing protein [Odoribacter sp.]